MGKGLHQKYFAFERECSFLSLLCCRTFKCECVSQLLSIINGSLEDEPSVAAPPVCQHTGPRVAGPVCVDVVV